MSALRLLSLGLIALALATGVVVIPAPPASSAPSDPLPTAGVQPILLLVDTSGSMADDDPNGVAKIEGAKTGLLRLLTSLPLRADIGLRTYPADGGDCGTGHEEFEVTRRETAGMSAVIRGLTPQGGTPTAEALRAAGDGLIADQLDTATIIVVSDGQSTCADPCPVARDLIREGLQVTIHTVGFSIAADDPAQQELTCLSNATGGTYTTAANADDLAERLGRLSAPAVDIELDTAETFNPEAQSALTVRATISNPTAQIVTDVRVDLRFDPRASGGAPAVTAPMQLLGNLEPGGHRIVSWTVHTTLTRAEGVLAYVVRAISDGALPEEDSGQIALVGGIDLALGGQLFRDADHVVVLGDSYSAGEGAGDYEDAAGGAAKGCHRSRHTYAVQLFGADRVDNLACSGAIINDHYAGQKGRTVNGGPLPSQQDQLDDVDTVDLVLLTMGGNDMGFADIITNCAAGTDCDSALLCGGPAVGELLLIDDCQGALPKVWQAQLGSLETNLVGYYEDVLADTGRAPVIVLPYVNPVPLSDRGHFRCNAGLPGVSPSELGMIRWLQTELNRHIAAAVETVRADGYENRLYYASDVETALEPDHTLCDGDPWLVWAGSLRPTAWGAETQELVHPNTEGYRAIAAALLRWSARVDPPTVEDSTPTVRSSLLIRLGNAVGSVQERMDGAAAGTPRLDLQDVQSTAPVSAGRPVIVQGSGYAPGASVRIGIGSTLHTLAVAPAGDDGSYRITVDVPEGYEGDHIVYAAGFTQEGDYLLQAQPVMVTSPPPWGALALSVLGSLVAVVGWSLLRRELGHRRVSVPAGENRAA
ncbi:GDSL-type esterase/lipase family protein [Geodermatophilus sp. SYSU D00710]